MLYTLLVESSTGGCGVSQLLVVLLFGVLGLVFGSFANVVIWRFPRNESLSHPASHCPRCDTPIRWYDNVPVLSWLALRGKCRTCGEPISARYPLVEVLSAALWVLAGARFGALPQAIAAVFFFYLLMILAFVDLDTMRLPNPLVALVGGGGLAGALVAQFARIPCVPLTPLGASWAASPVVLALVGAAASSVIALVIALAYQSVRGAQGLGMGDVKLLVAIGAFLGVYGVMVLFLGSLLAALWGVTAATMKRLSLRTRVPFGPFLALAAVIVAVAGPQMWAAYLGLVGM